MNSLRRRWEFLLSAVLAVPFFTWPVQAQDWRPVSAEELALTTPVVEKDADAEAIFWEVRLDDAEPDKTIFRHYLRMKVFNTRGVENVQPYRSALF